MIKTAWKRGILVLYLTAMHIRSKNILVYSACFSRGGGVIKLFQTGALSFLTEGLYPCQEVPWQI